VLKELADNALDVDTGARLAFAEPFWRIEDAGPGIAPSRVADLFSVNRPLQSSKLKRLPTRGALGNGLRVVAGAVAAFEGQLIVESPGHRLTLTIDRSTGRAAVAHDEACPRARGTTVSVDLGSLSGNPDLAIMAIRLARLGGATYQGASSPWWYAAQDFWRLLQHVPSDGVTVGEVCRDLGLTRDNTRPARSLSETDAAALLEALQTAHKPVRPLQLGELGPTAIDGEGYASKRGMAHVSRVTLPYVVEAWATCERAPEGRSSEGDVEVSLHANRTPTLARLESWSGSGELFLRGRGLEHIATARTGHYTIDISLIVPTCRSSRTARNPTSRRSPGRSWMWWAEPAARHTTRWNARPAAGRSRPRRTT
jgi:hypothetical protein